MKDALDISDEYDLDVEDSELVRETVAECFQHLMLDVDGSADMKWLIKRIGNDARTRYEDKAYDGVSHANEFREKRLRDAAVCEILIASQESIAGLALRVRQLEAETEELEIARERLLATDMRNADMLEEAAKKWNGAQREIERLTEKAPIEHDRREHPYIVPLVPSERSETFAKKVTAALKKRGETWNH